MKFSIKELPWTVASLISYIQENCPSSKVIMYNDTCAAVLVGNYQDSVKLGAESDWCISQHNCSWQQYVVKPQSLQMFFFNFSKKKPKFDSLVGATFHVDTFNNVNLTCCFGKDNHPICEYYKLDSDFEALNERILIPNFGVDLRDSHNYLYEQLVAEDKANKVNAEKELKKPITINSKFWDYVPSYSYYFDDDDDLYI